MHHHIDTTSQSCLVIEPYPWHTPLPEEVTSIHLLCNHLHSQFIQSVWLHMLQNIGIEKVVSYEHNQQQRKEPALAKAGVAFGWWWKLCSMYQLSFKSLIPLFSIPHFAWTIRLTTSAAASSSGRVVMPLICVLLAYNLCEIYSNTESGEKFAEKTLRQLRRQQARCHEVSILVCVGNSYAVLNARFFIGFILQLPQDAQSRLRSHFPMPEVGFTWSNWVILRNCIPGSYLW
jgi:hypothetical protein